MSSVSFFEQLTSSVSISLVSIISVATLGVILVYSIASRLLFSSSTKSSSSSKQLTNKDKKIKEANIKKQQQKADTSSTTNNKKNNNKAKRNITTTISSSSSSSSQSGESDNEKVNLILQKQKPIKSNKALTDKKAVTANENKKSVAVTNQSKTSSSKQQQVPERAENTDGVQSGESKKKLSKPAETIALNKQQTTKKGDTMNTTTTNKKQQPVVVMPDVDKRTLVDVPADSDHEDEGQWVTQGNKQINNRNRNKPKSETSNPNNQESSPRPSSSNRKKAQEKRTTSINNTLASATNKNEFEVETIIPSNISVLPTPQIQEPIEICQLLPINENRYTTNDTWWKQALNKQPTFSIDDIGEWPEREQDEEYVVQVKRIVPTKNISKTALTEKDINIDENDSINNLTSEKDDEKLNSNEQVNSSAVVTGETTTTSQSKKKSSNVRRIS
ncbi:unnamed protein product [Rotaria magnacalcarata]|uniref:Uncharacterized protein n=1 Tax=Rotaria magnacalcarata TaxID=392030 RepID=A0A818WKQ6_9BILA|nr:unnamed protein product [Rotaria magnacalcarata]CAF2264715.1 unnamed protein product [Rotaria magnacalcarata]CAF3726837.1 unnamed protein product [Rotaria magnacalcarata]CAF3734217.1 unnamed protein product [Rotaria magnacalcarata]